MRRLHNTGRLGNGRLPSKSGAAQAGPSAVAGLAMVGLAVVGWRQARGHRLDIARRLHMPCPHGRRSTWNLSKAAHTNWHSNRNHTRCCPILHSRCRRLHCHRSRFEWDCEHRHTPNGPGGFLAWVCNITHYRFPDGDNPLAVVHGETRFQSLKVGICMPAGQATIAFPVLSPMYWHVWA